MDMRIVLGIIGIVCVVILISRLTIFLFGELFGQWQYTLLLSMIVICGVGTLLILIIRKLIKEQSWHRP